MIAPFRKGAAAPLPVSETALPPQLQVRLEDTLAAGERLWVRGRLLDWPPLTKTTDERRWWSRWRSKPPSPLVAPLLVETLVSNTVLHAEATLSPDGRFEASLSGTLPLARRGWRVAKHRISLDNSKAETCGVILEPPHETKQAIAVVLPTTYTYEKGSTQLLANSDAAAGHAKLLRTLARSPEGARALYYLACVPTDSREGQAEVALATTAVGWPSATVVLLPARRDEIGSVISHAVDRLRWLLAGGFDLQILNLEPSAAHPLADHLQPAPDRATVQKLVNPEEDAWQLCNGQRPRHLSDPRPTPRPTRSARIPRYPVVFCHGMLAVTLLHMQLPEDLNCFSPLRDFLRHRGFRVFFPQVPATSGVVERATRLREQILSWTDEPINVIAHSMGGLDARYMITHLGMARRVRSLTTVSTPHRGTALADWFLANFRNRVPLLLALEAFGVNVDGFRDCRPEACRAFNAETPDRPEVTYFSYGGEVQSSRLTPALRRAWNLLIPIEGPNDGMVSLASSRWGEYLGTVHADHFAQTPDATFVRPGEDFDALGFFTRIVEDLARRGF